LGAVFAHFVFPKERHPFAEVVKLISSTKDFINKNKKINIVHSYKELKKEKVNIIMGVEGGHIFDTTFKHVEALYELGVRVFTLTWNNSNRLAYSALDSDKKGITKKGREYLKEFKNYDVILDFSHASTRTVLDVCTFSDNQVIASHSCVRALNPKFLRNIDDLAIKAITKKGGVIGINFSRYHLGRYSIADHISYLRDNFSVGSIAIGSDFDGINDAVISNPQGIKKLEKELFKKNYRKSDISRIFSGNFLRVLRKAGSRH
jgi:membrane dipeptidase